MLSRETREGWPLVTVELDTEANGDSWSIYERVPSLVGSLGTWSHRAGTIGFGPALAALVSSGQNIVFLTARFFTLLVPIPQQSGQAVVQSCWVTCLCISGADNSLLFYRLFITRRKDFAWKSTKISVTDDWKCLLTYNNEWENDQTDAEYC